MTDRETLTDPDTDLQPDKAAVDAALEPQPEAPSKGTAPVANAPAGTQPRDLPPAKRPTATPSAPST
ncbi:hypothetical protein [Leifsonia xyli]|uniref:hypothetical protein n=1 Tax=Leifsonia xyli TaxID=1575 RepID=UPI003D66B697